MKRYLLFCHYYYHYDSIELMGQSNDLNVAKVYAEKQSPENHWYIIDTKTSITHYNKSNRWETLDIEVKDIDIQEEE